MARIAPQRAAIGLTVAPPGKEFRIALYDGALWNFQPAGYLTRSAVDSALVNINAHPSDVRIVLRPVGWKEAA